MSILSIYEADIYIVVASLALLTYDILLTFDEEVAVIWPRPWTAIKCMFFFVRYFPLLLQMSVRLLLSLLEIYWNLDSSILFVGTELTPQFHFTFRDCEVWEIYQAAAALLLVATVDYLLILRVLALYDNHPRLKVIIFALSLGFSLSGIRFDNQHRCIVIEFSNSFILYGVSAVLFQTVLFSLTMFRFAQAVRTGWGKAPLLRLIVRDGTWAYLFAVLIIMGDVAIFRLKNHAFSGVLYGWMITGFSFSNKGYRILLNLGLSLRQCDTLANLTGPMRFGWEMDLEMDLEMDQSPSPAPPVLGVNDSTQHMNGEDLFVQP
ncbi:hypothetical protein K438DRAFT_1957274 [Mycena galopus ATCC 62051]|nr:hypothetical protein K438DRAFT_1957274 [Mycena galopus ATCC 62051]